MRSCFRPFDAGILSLAVAMLLAAPAQGQSPGAQAEIVPSHVSEELTPGVAARFLLPADSREWIGLEMETSTFVFQAPPSPPRLGCRADEGNDSPGERAVAGAASLVIPGAGQFYRGQRGKGTAMLTGWTGSLLYAVVAGIGSSEQCLQASGQQLCQEVRYSVDNRFWVGLAAATGFHVWSVLDALSGGRE